MGFLQIPVSVAMEKGARFAVCRLHLQSHECSQQTSEDGKVENPMQIECIVSVECHSCI